MIQTTAHIAGLGKITIRKKRGIKNMSIRVNGNGVINLSLPWYVPKAAGLVFVSSKKAWIKHQLDKNPEPISDKKWRELDKLARNDLPTRLSILAKKHGFKYKHIRYSSASTRWGSYSARGTISLNIQLMRLPDNLIDYVLVHELVHTKHLNHSPKFWAEVESIIPNYKRLKKQLKAYQLLKRT